MRQKPIPITEGIKVAIQNNRVTVEGIKGKITKEFRKDMKIEIRNNEVIIQASDSNSARAKSGIRALIGLTCSLINNMVIGVQKEFEKTLQIVGTGYRAEMDGRKLKMKLGYSHPIIYEPPEAIDIKMTNPQTMVVKGVDKQLVGVVASKIRDFKKPEVYKGKGIRYMGEFVRRKQGKKAV